MSRSTSSRPTALILFLEAAAAELIDDCCEAGEISVGSAVNVRHLAAAPIGAKIKATAKVTAVQGRRIDFAVEAHHGRKTLMIGTHQRVVVNQERFMKQHGSGDPSAPDAAVSPRSRRPDRGRTSSASPAAPW